MKNKKIKLFFIYLILISLISILLLISFNLIKRYYVYSSLQKEYSQILSEIKKKQDKISKIKKQKEKLGVSSSSDEMILKKYMVRKPGERVIEIID